MGFSQTFFQGLKRAPANNTNNTNTINVTIKNNTTDNKNDMNNVIKNKNEKRDEREIVKIFKREFLLFIIYYLFILLMIS